MAISLRTIKSNQTSNVLESGSITNTQIADLAITTGKIVNNIITTEKLADNTVTEVKLVNGSVSDDKLSSNLAANIAAGSAPKITTISYPNEDLAVGADGGDTVVITGSGFQSGATVYIGSTPAPTVTFTNTTSISFTTPALVTGTSYLLYVINPDGSTGIGVPGLQVSGTPVWNTSAGALTNVTEDAYAGVTLNAESDSNVTFSIYSGALPAGLTLDANTGTISGTVQSAVANLTSNTTYNFTVDAQDEELQNTLRTFSITYVPTFPTWYSPNVGALTAGEVDVAYTVSLNAISNSNVTYTIPSGNLIANVDISGNVLTGTPPEANTYYFTIRATDAEGHYTDREFSLNIAVGADTYFYRTSLLLQGTTSVITDSSTSNLNTTASGGAIHGSSFSPYNSAFSYFFDGDDYFQISSNSAFNMNTYACLEAWVSAGTTSGQQLILGRDSSYWIAYNFPDLNGGSGKFVFSIYNGSSWQAVSSTTTPTLHTWYHVVGVKDNTTLRIYINGVQEATASFSGSPNVVGSPIGVSANQNNSHFRGYIADARMNIGASSDVLPYTGNFTPPTSPISAVTGTVFLTCQSYKFADYSTNAFDITVNGNPRVSGFIPFTDTDTTSGSAGFTGSSYVTTPSNSNLAIGTNDFCAEVWVHPLTITNQQTFFSQWGGVNNDWILQYRTDDGNQLRFYYNGFESLIANYNLRHQWLHYVVCRSGGTMSMFANGQRIATKSDSTNINNTRGLVLGTNVDVGDQYVTGNMADARLVIGDSVYDPTSSTITVPTAPLTAIAGTAFLSFQGRTSPQNAGFFDESKRSNIIPNGNVTQGTFSPFSQPDGYWSGYFSSSAGGCPSTASSSALAFGTGDFTIEAWINEPSLPTSNEPGWFQSSDSAGGLKTSYTTGVQLVRRSITYNLMYTINVGGTSYNTTTLATANEWNHIAVSRESGTVRVFVNGVLEASGSNNANLTGTYAAIGGYYDTSYLWEGYISNLRVVKGRAVYTSNFTPPTEPLGATSGGQNPPQGTETSLLVFQSNRDIDNSTNAITITNNGIPVIQTYNPFSNTSEYDPDTDGGSGYFDGSGDYLRINDTATATNIVGPFTIEGWVYYTGTTGALAGRGGVNSATGWSGTGLHWIFGANTNNFKWQWYNGGAATILGPATTYYKNQWVHLAVGYDGTTTRYWVNGASAGTSTSSYSAVSCDRLMIGNNSVPDEPTTGYVSGLRFIQGIDLYGVSNTTITVPTAPPTRNVNSTLLCNFTKGGVIDAAGRSNLESVGNAQLSSAIKKYNASSFKFDGSGDTFRVLNANDISNFGRGDFTVEFWIYANSWASFVNVLDFRKSAESFLIIYTGGALQYYSNSGYRLSVGSPSTGAWHHVAVCRSNGTTRMFLDGSGQSNSYSDGYIYPRESVLCIGARNDDAAQSLNGYMDDIRITKGYARYTSDFTPPTEAFKNK